MSRFLRHPRGGFTLVEMLVSIVALTLLLLMIAQVFNSASTITTIGNKRMDADNQARPVLDRMAVDFAQMVKRSDVDYFLKQPGNLQTGSGNTGKNDQIAFYSSVPGYYAGSPSPISLVAYRINAKNQLERMGKGLVWNGVSTSITPVVFAPIPIASPSSLPTQTAPPTPTPAWQPAGDSSIDPDYEVVGPDVFRFEYYYQLNQYTTASGYSDSATPWDTNTSDFTPPHTSVSDLRDVGAIVVTIATIDPKSRVLLSSDAQLTNLAKLLPDYVTYPPGSSGKVGAQLQSKWQDALNSEIKNPTLQIPQAVLAGVRFYERYFYLNGQQQ